jgi:hypothetical protein
VRKPSVGAILLALIPFVAICFTVSLWDRIDPRVLGLPFNFFWLITWLLLTPLCMWGVYRLETRAADAHREGDGRP